MNKLGLEDPLEVKTVSSNGTQTAKQIAFLCYCLLL